MISTKERATLRSFANNLPDLVFVGKDGVTDNVIILTGIKNTNIAPISLKISR